MLIEQGPAADLHVYDIERDLFVAVTSDPALDDSPVWNPSGDHVAFHSKRDDPKAGGLYEKAADGSGPAKLVYTDPSRRVAPTSWHPNRVELLTNERTFAGPGIFAGRVRLAGDPVSHPLITDGGESWAAEFSPDGQWVAYNAQNPSIHVAAKLAADEGPGTPVSSRSGWHATWSADGHELFYRERRQESGVFATRISIVDGDLSIAPQRLFDDTYFFRQIGPRDYDVAPDGRFLMIKEHATGIPGRQINLVRHWTDTLTVPVPTITVY